jgi:hypothetical protein
LLQVSSLHQWHYWYLSKADYIAGPMNQMADDCSQLWHLSDSQLLAYFNCKYPQKQPWQLVHLQSAMHSMMMKVLLQQWPTPQSFLNELMLKTATGKFGKTALPLLNKLTVPCQQTPVSQAFFSQSFCNADPIWRYCSWQ